MELPLIYGENSDDTDSDWIPSNSKLPENDGMYICTTRLYNYYSTDGFHDVIGDDPQDHIMICQFRHNSFSEERCYQNVDVLAWMNIPNAYKS